jgi:DNA replication and repair protein RecF
VRVERLRASAFRCYSRIEIEFADGVTAIVGPNGAGKTSLLEAVHFGCLAWSPRTTDESRLVADGEQVTRVEVSAVAEGRPTEVAVGFRPGQPKRVTVDGSRPASLDALVARFPILVFTPDRLAVVKGAPATRRAYFDRAAARRWPAAAATSREFTRALSQRNHLLRRVRAGVASAEALDPWDEAVATTGAALSDVRARLVDLLEPAFAARLESLGGGPASPALVYRPHGPVDGEGLRELLRRRRRPDIERALTGAGPQHDDIVFSEARDVRTYGSQGEQRSALLALVLAEADTLTEARGERPLLLLDDVASELDRDRRGRLLDALAAPGQTLLTTTQEDDLAASVAHTVAVRDGALVEAA